MKQERIAILTDVDSMSNAGANLVGFQYAMAAQRDFEIEFWTSVSVDADLKPQNSYENIEIRRFLHSKRFGDFQRSGEAKGLVHLIPHTARLLPFHD